LLTWASFALLGVTLTSGVAGFILSIGMAVDANTSFQANAGRITQASLYRSRNLVLPRFSSILDGNVTVAITCGALFWLEQAW